MSTPVIDVAHPHGIWAGDIVTVGRGTQAWFVVSATPRQVIVGRDIPAFSHTTGSRMLRRYLYGDKIASLKVVSR